LELGIDLENYVLATLASKNNTTIESGNATNTTSANQNRENLRIGVYPGKTRRYTILSFLSMTWS
jgi:hypothetical protein